MLISNRYNRLWYNTYCPSIRKYRTHRVQLFRLTNEIWETVLKIIRNILTFSVSLLTLGTTIQVLVHVPLELPGEKKHYIIAPPKAELLGSRFSKAGYLVVKWGGPKNN